MPQSMQRGTWIRWAQRLGWGAFLFFLIKGLLWLTVPALIAWFATRG